MPDEAHSKLPISFHGRIIDHFGLEMYQKPVAALAELISNAWDADAETVKLTVPASLTGATTPVVVIEDDGVGMTFEDCKTRFLNIGYNTRGDNPTKQTVKKQRPLLGRKGIGKFAGFGVSRVVEIVTISEITGEKTGFEMDIEKLRGDGSSYVEDGLQLEVSQYLPPDEGRKSEHGTKITLKNLLLRQGINKDQFGRSMARRFLLHQRADDFKVTVNNEPLPEDEDLENIEFIFPRDYHDDEQPNGIIYRRNGDDEKAWGVEKLPNGAEIEWSFLFYKKPIEEDELRGVSIFTNHKLAQQPFLFNLTGGLGGQQGIEYLHGRVEAAYLDQQADDVIAPERQRINWEYPEAAVLEEWGKQRVKSLLRIWQERRNEDKLKLLDEKVGQLGKRLGKLQPHERKTVEKALRSVARVPKINNEQFIQMGNSILLSWEQGRLRDLVTELAGTGEMDEAKLLSVLLESQVLTALHTLEAVEAKVEIIDGLAHRIEVRELENPLRDYISEHPWLISPMWELFTKEKSVPHFIEEAREGANLEALDGFKKRVDLVLSGSGTLLVIEFMQPKKPVDFDHLNRFDLYVSVAREHIGTSTGGEYREILGYLVADKLDRTGAVATRVKSLEGQKMFCMDWHDLLERAKRQWSHYFDVLVERAPEDDRIQAIRQRRGPEGKIELSSSETPNKTVLIPLPENPQE